MGKMFLPLALIAYFNGIFLAIVGTYRRSVPIARGVTASLMLAWALQLGAIVHEGIEVGYFPLANVEHYLLILSWLALTLHLALGMRGGLPGIGVVLPPLAVLFAFTALIIPARVVSLPPTQQRGWFLFHVSISALGMAALCVAFAMAFLYLLQDHALKRKRSPGVLSRLPSLAACDRIGLLGVLWGFPLLTLGIVTGEVLSWATRGTLWIGGPKQIFPMLAWAVLAVLLYARVVRGFAGRKSAYVTITGFALGLFTVFGMTR